LVKVLRLIHFGRVFSGTQQFAVTLKNNGSGYEAFIPSLGETVANSTLGGVVFVALTTIGTAVGVTAGAPLLITSAIGTNLLLEANFAGIPNLWQEAVTEVLVRYDANGTQGIRSLIQDKATQLLDFFDGRFGDTNNLTPISDLITDMSSFFNSLKLTPLVVDLQNNGLSLSSLANGEYSDFDGDGFAEKVGWIASSEAFLVRDTNGNGVIDNVTEMFGGNGGTSAYQKLAALDNSGNGALSGSELSTLRLWVDADSNGITDAGELKTLAAYGIAKIDLAKQAYTATNAGNGVDGFVNLRNSSGTIISKAYDVLFSVDQVNSWYVGSNLATAPTVTSDALLSPLSRGYGEVKSLHLAISENPILKAQLNTIAGLSIDTQMTLVNQHINTMLALWAGQQNVAADSRPRAGVNYVNGQTLGILEKFAGEAFVNINNGQTTPDSIGSVRAHNAYFSLAEHVKETVLVQSVLKEVFTTSYYSFATGDLVMNDTLANILNRAELEEPSNAVQNKAYWGHIGGIIVSHADQFSLSANAALAQVNTKAGFVVDHYTLTLTGSNAVDYMSGTAASETITLLAGNDSITGGNGNDSLSGGDGDDDVYGDYDNDTLDGGAGNDSMRGGGDNDMLFGGSGNDTMESGSGADTLNGGAGADRLDAGVDTSADTFVYSSVNDSNKNIAKDTLLNFDANGEDKIDLSALGITGFDTDGGLTELREIRLSSYDAVYNRTLIKTDVLDTALGGNTSYGFFELALDGNYTTSLTAADFIFAA
jgi:Ca2+-binding RTX toxin-like protein